jgi:membrane-anchored protein YejM (alkaline phosphatase superfamily)
MSKKALIKRLSWYYPLEKFHAFVSFPLLVVYLLNNHALADILFLVYGLLVCIVILLQGQHYWKLKLHRLSGKPFNQVKQLQLFRKSEWANMILIGLMPLVLLLQLYFAGWGIKPDNQMFWAVWANAFAVLEHINYYHRQLMVDNGADLRYLLTNKRLKIASLRKDLEESKL